nr:Chain A, Phycoerythrin alpha subunit 1 [Hemiselmis pacifica]7T89_C Chain C, Phycoerythrin alpha subunit 1 [Hemiselmis pacifica]
KMAKDSKAPVVEIFDERDGCTSAGSTGKASDAGEKGLLVKVSMQKVGYNAIMAKSVAASYMNK